MQKTSDACCQQITHCHSVSHSRAQRSWRCQCSASCRVGDDKADCSVVSSRGSNACSWVCQTHGKHVPDSTAKCAELNLKAWC